MTGAQIWPWVLSAVSLTGFWFVGKKIRAGWLINLSGEVLWLTWSVLYHQYGFIMSVVPFTFIYALNWHRWRPAAKAETEAAACSACHCHAPA
jgi:hypothetical protein